MQRYIVGGLALLYLLLAGAVLAQPQIQDFVITGTVVGPDDQPLAGARVMTQGYVQEQGLQHVETTSAADGTFTLKARYDSAVARVPVSAAKEGLAIGWATAKPGEPTRLKLVANPVTVRGLVRNATGQPVADAEVLFQWARIGDDPSWGVYLGEAAIKKTDAEGRFSYGAMPPNASVSVQITAAGMALAFVELQGENEATIALQPEAIVSGRVLLGDKPVTGGSVMVQQAGPNGQTMNTMVNQDGTYTVGHLPAGKVRLEVYPPPGAARPQSRELELNQGDQLTGIDFVLSAGGLVRGRVTEAETGKPIAGAMVAVQGNEGGHYYGAWAQSDAEGKYELRAIPGKYQLNASKWLEADVQWQPAGDQLPTITVAEGETLEGQDIKLRPPPTLAGVVLLPNGQPAAGAHLQLLGNYGRMPGPLEAAADGSFQFKVSLPGPGAQQPPLYLFAQHPAQGLAALTPVPKTFDKLEIKLQPGAWLLVTAIDHNEKPLPGFPLNVMVQPEGQEQQQTLLRDQKTDAQGKLRLGPLPVGPLLRAMADWNSQHLIMSEEWRQWQPYALKEGEERALPQLQVNPQGRSLKVYVGDEQQKPVAGAKVFAGVANLSATTDDQGRAELTKLPLQGKVTVIAVHPKLPLVAAEAVDPGWDYWPGLILKSLGGATGQLVDAEGKPVAGMPVSANADQSGLWSLDWQVRQRLGFEVDARNAPKTDENGRFRLTGLIDGLEYSVVAWTQLDENRRSGFHIGKFLYRTGPEPQDVGQFTLREPAGNQ